MQYGGWMGKIVDVDLSAGEIREHPLEEDLALGYLGGRGMNARLLYDETSGRTRPLDPCTRRPSPCPSRVRPLLTIPLRVVFAVRDCLLNFCQMRSDTHPQADAQRFPHSSCSLPRTDYRHQATVGSLSLCPTVAGLSRSGASCGCLWHRFQGARRSVAGSVLPQWVNDPLPLASVDGPTPCQTTANYHGRLLTLWSLRYVFGKVRARATLGRIDTCHPVALSQSLPP